MGRVMLCVGRYAQTPYYLESLQRNVYCIEELCYSFQESAYLLDQGIVNQTLAEWLERECGLEELAGRLYGYLKAKCSVSVFVTVILEYAAWCSEEEIQKIRTLLQSNAGLGDLEKRKYHADYMVQQKRYGRAVQEYGSILDALPAEELNRRGPVCHNMGTAYAGLFLFETAAEWFLKAYEADGGEQSLLCWLAAKRFAMTEQEYIRLIAGHQEMYAASLELEQRLEQAAGQWEACAAGSMPEQLIRDREEGRMTEYYEEAGRLAEQMKEEYKRMKV